ncbi:hypothetical protein PMAYCL1PPCAC_28168 [Pristionchus mayeri]|uniref:Uncharacterized protein n=1 Tax=Pristionchus mayeri TaxID=1317129 RepID=A0AAN5I9R7_9BILA|nr:hypothetical protein PMAYCL1PPCAC_28168 [Pristionchus mayeri]
MSSSLLVVSLLLSLSPLLLSDSHQQRTTRVKKTPATEGVDDHHPTNTKELKLPPIDELPYCQVDPHEHLHWTIVGGIITVLVVSLIYVHQRYATVQYQHVLLPRECTAVRRSETTRISRRSGRNSGAK